ncbi:MAG: alpha/beta hydrolase, partial [Gemmatimonadota bacterium]|nr:alpha/beta hydrolase [Gemmatimonadota bacterium]
MALLLFVVSSLVILPAPTYSLWELSIGVTERGYLLVPVAIFAAFIGRRATLVSRLATILSLFSSAVLLIPLAQAAQIESGLDASLNRAFHASPAIAAQRGGNLSFAALFKPGQTAEPTTLHFAVTDAGSAGSDSLGLDFYPARGNLHAPLVVMIHGGSWQSGARTALPELNGYLSSIGYAVAAPSYRFAPAHPFPAALNDIRSAIHLLRANAGELGIDTSRIVIAGRSAGGELALLLAYTARDPAIRGAIGFYSPADMVWGFNHPSNPRVLNSTDALVE